MSELTSRMASFQGGHYGTSLPNPGYDALHWTLAREIERLESELVQAHSRESARTGELENLKIQAHEAGWIAGSWPKGYFGNCEECGVKPTQWHLGGCSKA